MIRVVGALSVAMIMIASFAGTALAQNSNPDAAPNVVQTLNDKDLWAVLIAAAVPWVVAFINRSHWSDDKRWVTFAFVAVIVGAGNAFFNGTWDTHTGIVRSILIVAVSALSFYELQKGAVKSFESRTSGNASP